MAGTFSPPSGTRLAASTPIIYTAERDVVAISVSFGSWQPEERVFRDGAFLPGYTRSFRDGLVYTIQRDTPWPSDPYTAEVFVDECEEAEPPTIPTGGLPLGAIYEVDLRTLPSQTLSNPGAYTIDGKTWYAKVPLTGQPFGQFQSNVLANGSGLGLASLAAQATRVGSNDALVYRHLFMPFAQLPGYNPSAPLLVRWHVTQSLPYANEHQMVVGVCSSTNDGVGLQATDRQYDHYIGFWNQGGYRHKRGAGSLTNSISFPQPSRHNREVGIYRYLGPTAMEVGAPTPDSWADAFIEDTNLLLPNEATLAPFRPASSPNPGVFVALDGQLDTTMVYLTHLQIMQPRIAA